VEAMKVLIACCGMKKEGNHLVKDIYQSTLFKLSLQYARTFAKDKDIFILSAKHGLLKLSDRIDSYDLSLTEMKSEERKSWASKVRSQLRIIGTDFMVLAGSHYYKGLTGFKLDLPLEGLSIGFRLKKLKQLLNESKS